MVWKPKKKGEGEINEKSLREKHWLGKNKGEGERLKGNQQRKKVDREIRVGYIRWKKKGGKRAGWKFEIS